MHGGGTAQNSARNAAKGAKVKHFAKRGTKPTAYSPATGEVKVKSEIAHKIRAVWIQMGKHGF